MFINNDDMKQLELLRETTNFKNLEQTKEYLVCSLAVKQLSFIELSYCFMMTKGEIQQILDKHGFIMRNNTKELDMNKAEFYRNVVMLYANSTNLISLDYLHIIFHLTKYDITVIINETAEKLNKK